jgi:hypothetical protein
MNNHYSDSVTYAGGLISSHISTIPNLSYSWGNINSNQFPMTTTEKNNSKIYQYNAIGLNKNSITVNKKFINKTKTLTVEVKGEFKDEVTEFKNNFQVNLSVDYSIYNKVSWKLKDGILTITLFEILNDEPEFSVIEG